MVGAPRLSTADLILKELKRVRKQLKQFANSLPNEDAYATPYSVCIDGINSLGELIKDLKPSLKDAKEHRKQFPEQFPNRARKWCVVNDSHRKSSASAEDAASPNEETA
jgi:hypothetical protein